MTNPVINSIFGQFLVFINNLLVENMPSIVLLMAALIGLSMLIHYFRRWIGGTGVSGTYSGITGEMLADHDLRNRSWKVGGGNEM